MKKIICVILSAIFLINIFCISSFAEDVKTIPIESFNITCYYDGDSGWEDITEDVTMNSYSSGTYAGMTDFDFPYIMDGGFKYLLCSYKFNLLPNRSYHLEFDYCFRTDSVADVYIYITYYDSDDSIIDSELIYEEPEITDTNKHHVSIDFSSDNSLVAESSYSVLEFEISQWDCSPHRYYISSDIIFYDIFDNSAILGNINDSVNNVGTKVEDLKGEVSNLGDSINNFKESVSTSIDNVNTTINNLGDKVSNKLDEVSSNISSKLDEVSSNIENSVESVRSEVVSLGDRIGNFFTELYENIINGLKSLFIPREGYFDELIDGFKSFFEKKLGILLVPLEILTHIVDVFKNLETGSGLLQWGEFKLFNQVIIPSGSYNLGGEFTGFLQNVFGTQAMYPRSYYLVVDVVITALFINFCRRKFNSITTGVDN